VALSDLTSPDAILEAIDEFDRIGRDAFLEKYGFNPSTGYELVHNGRRYDSKAIVGAAHGKQHPDVGPLSHADFNGGEQTTSKLRGLGFEVADVDTTAPAAGESIGSLLAQFLVLYPEARQQRFGGHHDAIEILRSAAIEIGRLLPEPMEAAKVRPSVGQGNWARVPWIAVLDPRETSTTQRGVYPVLLIPEDLHGVYMTLAQGVTELNRTLKRAGAAEELRRRVELIRPRLGRLESAGFSLQGQPDLGDSPLGRDYATSTIALKFYAPNDLPLAGIDRDVTVLLETYDELLSAGVLAFSTPDETPTALEEAPTDARVMCIYVGQGATSNFLSGGREGWWGWRTAPTGLADLRPGDLVLFGRGYTGGSPRVQEEEWRRHGVESMVAGRITEPPFRTDEAIMPDERLGQESYPWKFRFEWLEEHPSVSFGDRASVSAAVAEALRLSALTGGAGHLAPVDGSPLLERLGRREPIEADDPETDVELSKIASAFVEAVQGSGMALAPEPTIAFLSAALAKPFLILTGQSGSGKTQLAKRLGEWCGVDATGHPRSLTVPVRPDWTGAEFLFGFVDALQPHVDARPVWAVPDAMEFMFRALADPDMPYVLILDEMNLAHVERYFADFLSGIESRDPVLPALERVDNQWVEERSGGRRPLPRNLTVVGTVNVDETTYLFSPKVLDRAFTFEFRVTADELAANLRRPEPITAASDDILRTLVRVQRDDEWHFHHPHGDQEALLESLRELHRSLEGAGLEFGHRVIFESLRYAALLNAMTSIDADGALDLIALTKVLPKIHGSRQRLEPVLRSLIGVAAGDADGDSNQPRLPRSAAKLDRMLRVLLDAQFVSFTE
jgi:hypothetical protein